MTHEQKPLEILVADDDKGMRSLLSDVIAITGARVTTAVDGQDAIDKYFERYGGESPYDVVFTDLNMPVKTGVDVVREVKEESPETLVYVITGREPNEEYKKLETQLGDLKPDGVIGKPFDINLIKDIVGQVRKQKYGPENTPAYEPPKSQS